MERLTLVDAGGVTLAPRATGRNEITAGVLSALHAVAVDAVYAPAKLCVLEPAHDDISQIAELKIGGYQRVFN